MSAKDAHEKSSSEELSKTMERQTSNGAVLSGEVGHIGSGEMGDIEKHKTAAGAAHFNRLGWKRLTVVLIVEAIALGSLSLPRAFAQLGMLAGVILTVGLGLVAIQSSDVVGQVKLKYPHVSHYADAGRLLFGRVGYEVVGVMFILQLTFLVGSHALTGAIAFGNITGGGVCTVIWAVVSSIILLALAVPPSFAEVAILGYVDFASIILAILITIIATGVQSSQSVGGLAAVDWSMWPQPDLTFAQGFNAVTNIVFAYSFAVCQFSFMDEMHTPADYKKSIWALGLIEIVIYTVTGATVYAFVGSSVKSPALLSAGPLLSKIAFGVALPVIFISGSINTTCCARYIHGRYYKDSVIRFINTKMGWITWLTLITIITIVAFVIAEVIPFFSDLLSLSSSLFISGFSFHLPAMMFFKLIMEGKWYERKNWVNVGMNTVTLVIGISVFGIGTYAAIHDIVSPSCVLRVCRILLTLSRLKNSPLESWEACFRVPLLCKWGGGWLWCRLTARRRVWINGCMARRVLCRLVRCRGRMST
ncbi:hypothetical protein RB597_005864 [Gaeumannomyces tritici]